eukprot:2549080-Rhodomonas_salina.2
MVHDSGERLTVVCVPAPPASPLVAADVPERHVEDIRPPAWRNPDCHVLRDCLLCSEPQGCSQAQLLQSASKVEGVVRETGMEPSSVRHAQHEQRKGY